MAESAFRPGFRFSLIDAIVIAIGTALSIAFWKTSTHISIIIAFVVGHFFLFCNVFRIARRLELIWSGVFVALICGSTTFGVLNFTLALAASMIATLIIVATDMRSPSYHGVLWKRLNPSLPDWWAARQAASSAQSVKSAG